MSGATSNARILDADVVDEAPASEMRPAPMSELDVELSHASESNFFVGLTGEIATGGLFVATYRPLPVGASVDLELSLPSASLRVRGTVQWLREACDGAAPGVGIALSELSEEDHARVIDFCTGRTPLYYELDEPA